MDDRESTRRGAVKQRVPEAGPFSLGGENDICHGAVAALGALLDRRLAGLPPDCSNDELVDSALVEAMQIVPGTTRQVRQRLLSVAPYRAAAKPSRKCSSTGRR
jgi:hypothetical protein